MRKLLKRAVVVLVTATVALSMLEASASAAAPNLSATPPGSASAVTVVSVTSPTSTGIYYSGSAINVTAVVPDTTSSIDYEATITSPGGSGLGVVWSAGPVVADGAGQLAFGQVGLINDVGDPGTYSVEVFQSGNQGSPDPTLAAVSNFIIRQLPNIETPDVTPGRLVVGESFKWSFIASSVAGYRVQILRGPSVVASKLEGGVSHGHGSYRALQTGSYSVEVCLADPAHTSSCLELVGGGFLSATSRDVGVLPVLHYSNFHSADADNKFYPLVKDGLQDSIRLVWNQNRDGRTEVVIKNGAGKKVRQDVTNRRFYTWNGRRAGGSKLPVGNYYAQLHERDGLGSDSSGSLRLTIATGWKTEHHHAYRSGTQTTSRGARACHWHVYTSGQLTLDSWGGYCLARYGFSAPSNAWDVRGAIHTKSSFLDFGNGSISSTWAGGVASVNVTGWRAIVVTGVDFYYTTKRRI